MIDSVTAQKIKDASDIVEVVGDYVHLIRRGANYMGLCPFHNERTPSFSVNKRKNFCYCFSCKKGGSPVNFIMEKEGLSYHDALLHLAKKYGIEVTEKELTDEERAEQSEREAMFVANEWAMIKMEHDLHNTDEGRDIGLSYLYNRGVTDEAINKFRLGYAIDKGNWLLSAAKNAGYNLDILKNLGLIGTSREGREYDRFRGRVIFPVMNSAGKVVAFGGRDLKGGIAKYVNSPESTIYKKSNELYGIYQARADIIREDKCYLVEGYLDVIGMWQSGMKNVVASSGTALTDGQIALIHRFTENITLIYDGDAAGIKASLRGIDMLLSQKMKVKVLLLPDGDDPDSFAKKHTPEEFRKYVEENETDIIRFKAKVLLKDIQSDPQKRIAAVNSVIESLAHIPDPIARDIYIQECSTILDIPETTVAKSVARLRGQLSEKWKKERELKNISTSDKPHLSSGEQIPKTPPAQTEIQKPSSQISAELYPLEKKTIEYCVKYGFLDMCMVVDEKGIESMASVLDFVDLELSADGVDFKNAIFARIFSLLKQMKPEYSEALENFTQSLLISLDKERKEGIEKIADKDISISEIEKEEKKLNDKLEKQRQALLIEFSKDYPTRILASHEDDEIRHTVTDLIRERHQLSNIYTKDGNVVETEESRLEMLVSRAILEWKNELLNQQLRNLFQKFHSISGKGDTEAEKKLQLDMSRVMKMRSELAKNIGDRILSPKNKS